MTPHREESSAHLRTVIATMMMLAVILTLTLLGGISWRIWQRNHQLARIETLRVTGSSELADQQLLAQHYHEQIATTKNAIAAMLARYSTNAIAARYVTDLGQRARAEHLTIVQLAPTGCLPGYPPVTTYAIQLRGPSDVLFRWLAHATRNAPAGCCLAQVSLKQDGHLYQLAINIHALTTPPDLMLNTGPLDRTPISAGSREMESEP
ncbi:MAG: hypothetical protein ACUVX9_08025 [Anaerolineae bacterium]